MKKDMKFLLIVFFVVIFACVAIIFLEGLYFSKTQTDISAGYKGKPSQNVEREQVSPERVSSISSPSKERIYIPPTISVNFSFPTIMVLFGGLILYSVVVFVVAFIFVKKFLGIAEKLESIRRIDRDMIKRDDITRIQKKIIQVLQSEGKGIKDLLAKMGTTPTIQTKQRISQVQPQTPELFRGPPKRVFPETTPNELQPRSLQTLLEAYNNVNTQNRDEVDTFITEWESKKLEMRYDKWDIVSFFMSEKAEFLLQEINGSIYILPNFFNTYDIERMIRLEKCFEVEYTDKITRKNRNPVIEPATASVVDNSFRLKDKGKIEILKTPIRQQETKEQKGEPLTELGKIDIDEISSEYNKALHDVALRGNFLKSYSWENVPLDFQNISFLAEEDHYCVFPAFDCIIPGEKISDDIKKFFDAPSGFIRSIGEIGKIEPAKLKLPNLIKERGKIEIKG